MPIVFAVQRPDLTHSLAFELIYWTLLQHGSNSSEGRTGGAIELPGSNASSIGPYFAEGVIEGVNNIEASWYLSWTFAYGSCKPFPTTSPDAPLELDTSSIKFASQERFVEFSTNKTAPAISLQPSDSSETCRSAGNVALNITNVLKVYSYYDFHGYLSCAILGSTPTESKPCAVKMDATAVSSVAAAVAFDACQATATGYMPCASLRAKSAGHATLVPTTSVGLAFFGMMICMLL
jgi:hypothetical protein